MKNYISLMRECCLAAALLMAFPIAGKAAMPSKAFRARASLNKAQTLTRHLTHSDTIPLTSRNAVYALSIDATIQQPREASFVRIVLEDTEGHNYLVAESDRFRNDTATVQLSQYCEETALLGGITPACLKCYLAGGATLTLTGIHTSDEEPMRLQSTSEETAKTVKEAQVQDIVDRINEYNTRHGKLWRAGMNNWALADYGTEAFGEEDAYTANFKYYTDGIYEMGERPRQATTYQSPYVDSFDWRDRHGKNWITNSLGDQTDSLSCCQVFASVGATEALANLYFNSKIDLNLSEQYVLKYSTFTYNEQIESALLFLRYSGTIDEASLMFGEQVNGSRPEGEELVKIGGFDNVHGFEVSVEGYADYLNDSSYTDSIKSLLIKRGPGIWGYNHSRMPSYENTRFNTHFMELVGYGQVTPNDYYTFVENNFYYTDSISNGSTAIGQTYWIFKDSFGHRKDSLFHHNGYRYVIIYDYHNMLNHYYYLTTPIYRRDHTDDEIVVEDADGDGYFNWGIGSRPDDRLPAWASLEEDADDSNENIGCFSDNYGHESRIGYGWSGDFLWGGYGDVDTTSAFIRGILNIEGTYTIKKTKVCHPDSKIFMYSNSTFIIDGGILVDPTFEFEQGCNVILKNGGKIYYTQRKNHFALPLGLSLQILSGKIQYISDYSQIMP